MQESSLAKIPQLDVTLELDDPPTREEIKKATMQLKVGKTPGIDGTLAEDYQLGGDAVLGKLQDLFTNCWEKGTLPKDLSCSHCLSVQKQRRKIRLFKLQRHYLTLHCRQNLGSSQQNLGSSQH